MHIYHISAQFMLRSTHLRAVCIGGRVENLKKLPILLTPIVFPMGLGSLALQAWLFSITQGIVKSFTGVSLSISTSHTQDVEKHTFLDWPEHPVPLALDRPSLDIKVQMGLVHEKSTRGWPRELG